MPRRVKQQNRKRGNKNKHKGAHNKRTAASSRRKGQLNKTKSKPRATTKPAANHDNTEAKREEYDARSTSDEISSHDISRVIEGLESNQKPSIPQSKMSKALKYQTDQLADNPSMDYVLVGKTMDYGVQFANFIGKTFFRVCQNKAMEKGDERSIGMMYQMLYDYTKQYADYHAQDLQKQLYAEYGKNIDWNRYAK